MLVSRNQYLRVKFRSAMRHARFWRAMGDQHTAQQYRDRAREMLIVYFTY